MFKIASSLCIAASLALTPSVAFGEILAMVNYETKSPESLKALKSPVAATARKEGIAIIDVDPTSKNFGKIVQDIALPGDLVAHHNFYNRDQSKACVTALGKEELRVIDMKSEKVIGCVDTLKNTGYNPNSMVLLPRWNDLAGH